MLLIFLISIYVLKYFYIYEIFSEIIVFLIGLKCDVINMEHIEMIIVIGLLLFEFFLQYS